MCVKAPLCVVGLPHTYPYTYPYPSTYRAFCPTCQHSLNCVLKPRHVGGEMIDKFLLVHLKVRVRIRVTGTVTVTATVTAAVSVEVNVRVKVRVKVRVRADCCRTTSPSPLVSRA